MLLKDMCKEIRQKMKLSQKQLASIIGTTQTEISFIEGGFTPPNEEKTIAIKKLYERNKE